MKTFNICSDCSAEHHWREIDYDNALYRSTDTAICLTLCSGCVNEFSKADQNNSRIVNYKQKINIVLKGKSKTIPDLIKQNNASSFWGLSF